MGAPIQNESMELYDDGMMNTTMRSMGEVMNMDSMKMMNSMGAEVRTDDRMMTKCVHKRGTCITHNIKGKKSVVKHFYFISLGSPHT